MPKVSKKVSAKRKVAVVRSRKVARVSSDAGSKQMMLAAIVVVSTCIFAPLMWLVFRSVWVLFVIPAVASLVTAFMFKEVTGTVMSEEFRKETTTITAVFAVVLAVLSSLNLPAIGLDGRPDNVLPIFMIIYMSVWAIVAVLVTVYLPLGVTVDKKK
ncbi:hypothetical protein CO112_02165 [Candidatus Dojkabacteria bacterium CG_4_9_14_3_um_filter_150_Dojkabacteria_WS6_41_13]|uniref:Uncharacterized protein n=1 Tax=Candidatus Dojkabacteria bacterium CG_4_10_14_0_2_um_filter_Dojkabacteria_WS6_41_15 TaxID=2014249 RepID=A0A2M7W359_9BACT|nr:MAG: hypothetical protein COZ14_04290 [Candidatus Dojkabacteria bacterium CG_4_10_14_3_um_filter_Dojkabacteria_WS6_41_9]PJA15404.1 MAG: hypothetical protein COX64_00830 [Candidatus Dojkabacteria bacterium CG_4_10_14_0_2_um_filter_Dojkabacteria_WS6_41_15]PJB22853.1 MAG: hypothetical protein CO112_02165 [Candidatus Dojkabacteria bacterium CG_4_9_14_3_um_filter_150_Dojkabacteria_WS6_41_13]